MSRKWSFIKSNWGVLNPFVSATAPWLPTFDQFCCGFANGLPAAVQRAAYDEQVVPESRQGGSGPTTDAAAIDFARPHPPLLLVAGGADNMIPASLNTTNHARCAQHDAETGSRTELVCMADRTHLTLGQPGWEAVADRCIDWIAGLGA